MLGKIVLAAVGLAALWEAGWRLAGVRRVTPGKLARLLAGPGPSPLLADARTGPEYRWLHIPGAVSLPDLVLDPAALPASDRDTPVVVICMTGHRSPVAAWRLRRRGFRNVTDLVGGMLAWRLYGGETVSGPEPGGPD